MGSTSSDGLADGLSVAEVGDDVGAVVGGVVGGAVVGGAVVGGAVVGGVVGVGVGSSAHVSVVANGKSWSSRDAHAGR